MAEWNEHVLSVRARLDKASKQEMIDSVRDVFTEGAHIDFKSKENLRALHELADIMNKIFSAAGNTKFDFSKMINLPGPELFDGLKEAAKEFDSVWNNVVQKFNSTNLKDFFMQDLSALDTALQRVSKSAGRVKGLEKAFKDVRLADPEKILERLKATQSHYTAADNINWEDQYADLLQYIKLYEKYVTNANADTSKGMIEKISQIGPYTYKQLKEVEAQISTSLQNIFNLKGNKQLIGLTDSGRINFEVVPTVVKTLEVGDVLGGKQNIEIPVVFKAKLDLMRNLSEEGDFDQLEKLQDEIASMFPENIRDVVLGRLEKFAELEKTTARSYSAIYKDFIGYGMPVGDGSGTGFGSGDGTGTGDASSAELEAANVKIGQLESEVESLKTEIEKIKKKAVKEPQPKKKMVAHEEVLALQAQITEKENEIDALRAELEQKNGAGGVVGTGDASSADTNVHQDNIDDINAETQSYKELISEIRRYVEIQRSLHKFSVDAKQRHMDAIKLNTKNNAFSGKAVQETIMSDFNNAWQKFQEAQVGLKDGTLTQNDVDSLVYDLKVLSEAYQLAGGKIDDFTSKQQQVFVKETKDQRINNQKEARIARDNAGITSAIPFARLTQIINQSKTVEEAVQKIIDELGVEVPQAAQKAENAIDGAIVARAKTSEDVENARKVAEYEAQARAEAEAREQADKRRKELAEQMELYADDGTAFSLEESEGQKAALQEILNTLKQENLLTDELRARYDIINSEIDERIRLLKSVQQAYDSLEEADKIDYHPDDIDEVQQALNRRRELVNAIPQDVIDNDDDIAVWVEEIKQDNIELEKRIGLLQQVKQGLIDIYDVDDIMKESGDLDSKLERLEQVSWDWGSKVKDSEIDEDDDALEALQQFEDTYDRIVLKLANGRNIEILPNAKGLRALYKYADGMDSNAYGESEIADVEFVRKEIQQIQPEAQQAQSSLDALYKRGSDAAKKAIQDMAIANNKLKEFDKMVATNPEPRNQFIPLSEEERAGFLNVAKEYQNVIKQINDLEVVAETEDDKQRLIDLKTEAIKLHKVLAQAFIRDGNIDSYIKEYGLSRDEAEKFYSSIRDQNPQKFIEQIRQEYQTNYDDSFDRMEQLNPEFRQQMFKDMSELEALMDRLAATQENLNHVESQNPPAQDDSGTIEAETESIENKIKSYEELSAAVSRYIELAKTLVDTEKMTPEHQQIQKDMDIVDMWGIDAQEDYIKAINEQQEKIKKIKAAIKIGAEQYKTDDGYVEQITEDTLGREESKLRGYIYQYAESFDDIDTLLAGAKTKTLKNIITKEIGKFTADQDIQTQHKEIAEAANAAALAEMEQIENLIEGSAPTEKFNKVFDTLGDLKHLAHKVDRYTQSSITDGLANDIGVVSPHKEIENNAQAIKSYEELCGIVERYNELMKKRYIYTGDEYPTLSEDEENEFAELTGRLNATRDGVKVTYREIEGDINKLAQLLGIEVPRAAQQAESAVGQLNGELTETGDKAGNLGGQAGDGIDTGTVQTDGATTEEVENLKLVSEKVAEITAKVKEKNKAFLEEQSIVKRVAKSETDALEGVKKVATAIRVELGNVNTLLNNIKKGKDIGAGLSNININVNHKNKEKKDEPVSINADQLKSTLESVVYNVKIAHSDTDKNANKVAINAADLESVLRKVFSNKPGEKDKAQPKKQLPKIDSGAVKTETDTLIEQYRRILSTIEEWKTLYEQLKTITFGSTTDFRKQMLPMLQNMSPELVKMVGGSFAENFANGFKGIKTKDIFAQLQGIVSCDLLGSVTDQVNILNSVDFDNFNLDELKISSINAVYFLEEAFELLKKIDALKNGVIGGLDVDITGEKKDEPRKESYALENTLQNVAKILTKIQENTASLKGVKLQQAVDANTDASRQVAAAVEGEGKSGKTAPKLNKVTEKYSSDESDVPFRRVETESEKTGKSYRTTKTHKRPMVDEKGNWTGDYEVDLVEVIDDYDKIRKESDKTKKMVERAQKKVDEFVAKFDSKTGGNAKFIDGFDELNGFEVTADNIDIAYNKMIMLQQKYAELEKNFRKGQSSLNPFVNAINKSQNIGNIFGDVEDKFNGLIVRSDELTANFNELKKLSEQIQAFTQRMETDPDSITPADFTEFSKQMGEFTSLKTQVDSMIRSETSKNKEVRTHNAQVEAEIVKKLIKLYEQLGRARAKGDTDEGMRIRDEIDSERGKLSSIDYATDMKFKHAKEKGFSDENEKITNTYLAEQENKIKTLNKLYQEYGVLVERAGAASGHFGEQLRGEVAAKEAEIQALRDSMDVITPEMFNGFDEAFDRGRNIESAKQYEALAKKSDADEATRLRNIAGLEKEIGRLKADADAATNDGIKNALEEEIKLREELIRLQEQGLEMNAQDEAYYRQNAANKTRQAKADAKQEIKDRKDVFKEARKLAQREAMLGKTGSAVSRAENTWASAVDIEGLPADFETDIDKYYQKLDALRKKHQELKNSDMISEEQKKELIAQTREINKMTSEIGELVAEYQRLSGDNATVIGVNALGSDASLGAYEQQLKQTVMTATHGKAQIKGFDAATKTLTYTVKTGKNEFTEYTAAVRRADGALVSVQGATKRTETFIEATVRKLKEITSYMSGMSLISRAGQELRRGIQYVREIDLALTELKKVTDETEESYDKFLETAAKTADKVGSTIQKVVSSTADWARLGYSMEQAAKLAESTQILMNVSEFTDVSQATDTLISSVQAFGYTAETSMDVVDLLNTIGKIIAYR